jgi:hypothetical protein
MTDSVSISISALSLIVSGVATWIAWKAHRKTISLQQRMLQIEEQRERDRRLMASQAQLHPELRATTHGGYRLYIVNSGMAPARNLRVILDNTPLTEHPAAVQNDPMPTLVGPNSEVSCLLALMSGCSPPFDIELQWEDDSSTNRAYKGTLTF